MCTLERFASGPAEARRLFNVGKDFDLTGNLEGGDIYPRRAGPVIRQRPDGAREMVMMYWGFPHLRKERKKDGTAYAPTPTVNIRNPHYPMWRDWTGDPRYRCLVPSTAFAEPNPLAKQPGQPRNIWFGLKQPREGLYAFAGLWRPWDGDWNKERGAARSKVYAFLTCAPNELVAPIHGKAMPVILDPDDYETWLTADWAEAKALQRPFPAERMAVYES